MSQAVRFFRILLVVTALGAVFHAAQAQDTETVPQEAAPPPNTNYVKIRILPEYGQVEPGEDIWVGIEESIAPGWHTYWKNPGDSGAAPRVKWSLPSGFTASDLFWPVPHRIAYGPLMNFGYSDHVILLQKLRVPDVLPPGPVSLKADVEVLVCKDECIPEYGTYETVLNGPEGAAEDNSSYLEAARAALPIYTDLMPVFSERGGNFRLEIPGEDDVFASIDPSAFEFFPEDWGLVDNPAPLKVTLEDGVLAIEQKRGQRPLSALKDMHGVLAYTAPDGSRKALSFTASRGSLPDAKATMPAPGAYENAGPVTGPDISLIQALAFALLGGLILNLMPCVFPVLSIKALSLVKISEKHPGLARRHGMAYTAGVILSFVGIAALLIALKSGGAALGWGFQLQDPLVVTLLAYLLFIIGLNLAGFFEVGGSFVNFGGRLTSGEGLAASFFTGILATLVATPCTAPFMAGAIGYALVQPAYISLGIFAALGFGLALPYLMLSLVPPLRAALPRPGAWMHVFRQLLSFPMFASAAWLVWVLDQQVGSAGTLSALMGMVALAFGTWLLSHKPVKTYWKIKVRLLAAISFLLPLIFLPAQAPGPAPGTHMPSFGEMYDAQKLTSLLEGRDPVFVEMTAAWCITCKVNHGVAIDIESTRMLFADRNVHYLVGDWTNQDPAITGYLNSFGRNGVPLYVYYGPPGTNGRRPDPVILPQVLTPGIVQDIISGQ